MRNLGQGSTERRDQATPTLDIVWAESGSACAMMLVGVDHAQFGVEAPLQGPSYRSGVYPSADMPISDVRVIRNRPVVDPEEKCAGEAELIWTSKKEADPFGGMTMPSAQVGSD
ncbi:MAG: hypothetical protein JNN07_23195 [Verrucomicrobiales bacterium]|nr:hypothetical protein [Verrucomicrobiales bacterium]